MEPFLSSFLLLLVLTSILPSTVLPSTVLPGPTLAGNYCSNAPQFKANSTYQSNLRQLLHSVASSAAPTGFSNSTIGSPPNRIEALALCRGDLSKDECKHCLDVATSVAEKKCTYAKSATIFYYSCHIRYSDESFINTVDTSIHCFWDQLSMNPSDTERFIASVRKVLEYLRDYAVHNATSPPLFAYGRMEYGGIYGEIYGMVQCTRDISADQCGKCLDHIITGKTNSLVMCYKQRRDTVGLTGTCGFRYRNISFLNDSTQILEIPPLCGGSSGRNNIKVTILAIAISSGVVSFSLNLIGCICLYRRKGAIAPIRSSNGLSDGTMQETSTHGSLFFSLDSIKRATNNFSPSNELGKGGFGPVYQGKLSDGRHIAVKRLSGSSSQGIEELNNEILLQTRLRHKNLAIILGACIECGEKMLIYEFVENKSLDAYLLDPVKKLLLNWEVRRKIIAGIARGMLYLHEESQVKIIHRDIKASNILLDGDMNPKISDFGMARLFDEKWTHACTKKVAGTFGYMPPEYVMEGKYSIKSDIYSFGVLVLEIITGRRNWESLNGNSEDVFLLRNYVWEHWSRESLTTVVDASMEGNYPCNEALRFIQIGLLCIQDNPKNRPTMENVYLMLSSDSVSIPTPLSNSRTTFNAENFRGNSSNEASVSDFDLR